MWHGTWCSKCHHWGTCSYKNTSRSRPAKEAKERRGSIESVDDLWSGRGRSMEKHPAFSFLLERSIHELNDKILRWLYWRATALVRYYLQKGLILFPSPADKKERTTGDESEDTTLDLRHDIWSCHQRIKLKINIQTHVTAFAPVVSYWLARY